LRAEPLPGERLAPAAVALRKLAAGKTNAMRNEHVEPVSPNANATFGTYSERYNAHVMDVTATTVASRFATSGGTVVRSSIPGTKGLAFRVELIPGGRGATYG
jgi:hypothetical protein